MPQNYQDLGLNERLQSENSLAAKSRKVDKRYLEERDAFYPGQISHTRLNVDTRAFQAVVDVGGAPGTYRSIQDAIEYVNRIGGGRILVLPGTQIISSNITLYNDITIQGLSTNDCVLDFNNGTNNITIDSRRDVTLNQLTFQNCQNTTTGCINIATGTRVIVDHCQFSANRTTGSAGNDIFGSALTECFITYNTTLDPATFYNARSSTGINYVTHNRINRSRSYAIVGGTAGNGAGQTVYDSNYFQHCVSSLFFGNFNFAAITNSLSVLQGSLTATCLDFNSSSQMLISNNRFDAEPSNQACIDLDNSSANKFTNNFLSGKTSGTPIIQIGTSDNTIFTGNFIDTTGVGTTCDGIKLINSDNCIISGNWIQGGFTSTNYGVNVSDAASSSNIIVGNWLNASTGDVNDAGTLTINANNR